MYILFPNIMQLFKVMGVTLVSPLGELSCDGVSYIYTFHLTGYATESNEKKYICCFMRTTQAINSIYKLISFFLIDCLTARQHIKVNLCQQRGRETSSGGYSWPTRHNA